METFVQGWSLTIVLCGFIVLVFLGGWLHVHRELAWVKALTDQLGAELVDTSKKPKVTVPSGPPPTGLEVEEIVEGTGAEAKAGDEVSVQYVGVGYESEEEFDSSWSRNEPFSFQLGAGMVIPGWDQGVAGMKVGGRRELIIPPELAYGEAGSPPGIGPNETLIFVIDLLAVK